MGDAPTGLLIVGALLAVCLSGCAEDRSPVHQLPENPHYLAYEGAPILLVTSGEHYGAVLNGAFPFEPYLEELASHGLNQTRTFSGTYREVPASFGIEENTLAPVPGDYVAPWARVPDESGPRYDLTRWNPDYFDRLHRFLREADRRDVVVELVLFCTFYEDTLWAVNPMNTRNNVQELDTVGRMEVFDGTDEELTDLQERFVRKLVRELNEYDNLYYEIANEPYFGGFTRAWKKRMISAVVETEEGLPQTHLIAQNVANESARIEKPHPETDVFNFHYAVPGAVDQNYGLDRVLGDDETGFDGSGDAAYRTEAWQFLLAGGGIFGNLDYSYSVDHPAGTGPVDESPGGGGESLRRQLGFLRSFLGDFDLASLGPADSLLVGGVPDSVAVEVIGEADGEALAAHIEGGRRFDLRLRLPPGVYRLRWIDPVARTVRVDSTITAGRDATVLTSPNYRTDVVLELRRTSAISAR